MFDVQLESRHMGLNFRACTSLTPYMASLSLSLSLTPSLSIYIELPSIQHLITTDLYQNLKPNQKIRMIGAAGTVKLMT